MGASLDPALRTYVITDAVPASEKICLVTEDPGLVGWGRIVSDIVRITRVSCQNGLICHA